MNYLSLKDLARELDDLREREEDTENPLDDDEKDKLKELVSIEDSLGDLHVYSRDVIDVLIDDDDFNEHIEQEMEEIYPDLSHLPDVIKNGIDWDNVASEMRCDYNEVEYCGTVYQIRAG